MSTSMSTLFNSLCAPDPTAITRAGALSRRRSSRRRVRRNAPRKFCAKPRSTPSRVIAPAGGMPPALWISTSIDPLRMVPDDEDFRPASRELDRREAPHPARRPREQHCLPFHARVHRDLLDKSYKVFSKLITVLPATLPLVTAYVALPLLSSNVRKSLVLFDLHVSSMQRSVKQLMATKEPATYT